MYLGDFVSYGIEHWHISIQWLEISIYINLRHNISFFKILLYAIALHTMQFIDKKMYSKSKYLVRKKL